MVQDFRILKIWKILMTVRLFRIVKILGILRVGRIWRVRYVTPNVI